MPSAREHITRLWMRSWQVIRRRAPRSRTVALVVIAGLLVAVTVLRWFVDGAGQAAALLYVVPIALGALRFGRRGGIAVASFGILAFGILEVVHARGDLDMTGWVGPLLAMALIGFLVGHLSELASRGEARRRLETDQIEEMRDAQRSTVEASDAIVQRVAAARWMLEAGKDREALAALGDAVAEGIVLASSTLPPLALHADGEHQINDEHHPH